MYHGTTFGHAGPTPEFVMRTGAYALFDPLDARQDVKASWVSKWTNEATGRAADTMPGIRNTPPSIAVGPIKQPGPQVPIQMPTMTTPSESMQGYFGYFGADAPVPAVVLAPAKVATATWLLGGAAGFTLGALGGVLVSRSGRRATGGLTGAAIGAASAAAALLLVNLKG